MILQPSRYLTFAATEGRRLRRFSSIRRQLSGQRLRLRRMRRRVTSRQPILHFATPPPPLYADAFTAIFSRIAADGAGTWRVRQPGRMAATFSRMSFSAVFHFILLEGRRTPMRRLSAIDFAPRHAAASFRPPFSPLPLFRFGSERLRYFAAEAC